MSTTCTGFVLDEDGEAVDVCGGERGYCEACETRIGEQMLREWLAAPLSERDPAEYATQMVDAGRGHLLNAEERALVRTARTWDRIFDALAAPPLAGHDEWPDAPERESADLAADDAGSKRFGEI